MTRVNQICLSILMLGAATVAVPALAQSADAKNGETTQAQPANDADTSAGQATNTPAPVADNAAAANTQTAMNNSSASADVSSMGDTSKKYHRATRGKDFRAEQKITQQLNQQASAAAKPTQTAAL